MLRPAPAQLLLLVLLQSLAAAAVRAPAQQQDCLWMLPAAAVCAGLVLLVLPLVQGAQHAAVCQRLWLVLTPAAAAVPGPQCLRPAPAALSAGCPQTRG